MTDAMEGLRSALADRYTIKEELGRGGMATVYLAEDLKHHRQVAIKVLHPDLGASLAADRFLREIQIAAQLNHPHILAMLDSGEADGFLYYVMPVVEGESLGDRLRRETQLPVEEAVRLTREIADALGAAHQMGVVHRDLKPANVLLSGDHAILADFGIARAVTVGGGDKLTETGLVVGTPSYMAPEQATGSDKIDARTDVYALGCVLYEMLAGEAPFNGPTPMAVLARHSLEQVPSIRIVRQTVPAALEAVIEKAMAKVPVDRYATAAKMATALEASLREPADDTVAPVRGARPARSRVPVALVGWSAITLVVVLGAGMWSALGGGSPQLDTNLIAVAPFDAFDPALDSWSKAAEAGLSRTLDGMGPLRALAPTSVSREGVESIDAASAVTIGQQSGAGVVVFGSLTPLGSDSVQGRVTVVDVATGEPMGDLSAASELGRISEFVDSLTVGIVDLMTDGRQLGAGPFSGTGSVSVPAMKAFLQGEQQVRRAAFDSAVTSYHETLKEDSTIALAYYRLALVLGYADRKQDSLWHYLSMADTRNIGLSLHDSLVVESGACMARVHQGEMPDSVLEERAGDCRSIAQDITVRFPHDPEGWLALALIRREFRKWIDLPPELGTPQAVFDSVLTKDPGYGLAYAPALMEAMVTFNLSAAQRLASDFLAYRPAFHPPEAAHATILLLAQVLDPEQDTVVTNHILDSVSSCEIERLAFAVPVLQLVDSFETTVRIGRALYARANARCLFTWGDWARRYLGAQLLQRGYLREAFEVVSDSSATWFPTVFPELALWGDIPTETVDSVFSDWLASDYAVGLGWAPWWWAQQHDTMSIKSFISRDPDNDHHVSAAFLQLARGDTTEALSEFAVADHGMTMHYWPLVRARLLVDEGKDREAFDALSGGPPGIGWRTLTHGFWALERARVAERLGDNEAAIKDYQRVTDVWLQPDESLQVYVEEARSALDRLAS
jgi:hypothetical protein